MQSAPVNTSPSAATCRVCHGPVQPLFDGPLLSYRVRYEGCARCGYVQTETPYWLDEAYGEAINRSDTGILRRNARTARIVLRMLAFLGCLQGRVVDAAGGYGLLVRMLRDHGVDAWWADRYCQNLVARGFEADSGMRADLVTAFEAFEHFVHPAEELAALLQRADHVLLSTDLIPDPTPQPGAWWYYAPEHGQHIGFYRLRTLQWLAQQVGCHVVSDGKSFHMFSKQPIAQARWMWARRTAAWAPLWTRGRLRSRVWTDHAQMVAAERAAATATPP